MRHRLKIFKKIFELKRDTGFGWFRLLTMRWDIEIYGYGSKLSTWQFAEMMVKYNLRYLDTK